MNAVKPRLNKDEFARRGDELYERTIRSQVEPQHAGEFVALDIESGAYEVDGDELKASDRLLARMPEA